MHIQLRDRDHLAARNIQASAPLTRTDKATDATPIHLLYRVRLFHGLGAEGLAAVLRGAAPLDIPAGKYIFRNDKCETVYLLEAGRVAITQTAGRGAERFVRWVRPAELFGAMGELRDQLRPASAQALCRCRALSWKRESIGRLMRTYPLLALNALSDLEDQLWEFQRHHEGYAERLTDSQSVARMAGR